MGDDVEALKAKVLQLQLVIAQKNERYEAVEAQAGQARAALESERALRRAAEERAALLAVPAGAAPRSASGMPAGRRTIVSDLKAQPLRSLQSPSAPGGDFFRDCQGLCCFGAAPLTLLAHASPSAAFDALLKLAHGDLRALSQERIFYRLAAEVLPAFAERVGDQSGSMEASTLFTHAAACTHLLRFALQCKPELHVRGKTGEAGRRYRPGFNGELKTAGDEQALEQALYYVLMDMVRIFFPAALTSAGKSAPGPRRFFTRPPLGFALVAFALLGYFVAVEWVGIVHAAPLTQPFMLGSAEHRAAAAALPDESYDEPEELDEGLPWRTAEPERALPMRVSWCVSSDGRTFRKLVAAGARTPAGFAAMHRTYQRLARLPAADAARPAAVVAPCRLLYGAHEVLVVMPAVAGASECTDDELLSHGAAAQEAVAEAVAWLAVQHGVVYTDVRGPNVLLQPGESGGAPSARLVDYDDCETVEPGAVATVEAYERCLAGCPAAAQADTFAAVFCARADRMQHLRHALERAFAHHALQMQQAAA